MNQKLLAVIMITGFLFSTGSVYLNHLVFADDPWSDIAARQHIAEQKALATYNSTYQFANMDQSKRDWSGLTSTATNSTGRERNLAEQANMSLQNAVLQFDQIHIKQIADLQTTKYQNLTSTQTDTTGRDRDVMLSQAQSSSLFQAEQTLAELTKIQVNYANFSPGDATDMTTFDRQAKIEKTMSDQEAQAASLVSQLAKLDQVYVNLEQYVNTVTPYEYKPGSITNEMTHGGRQLAPQAAYSLEKAIMIFNEIHDKHLTYLKSNYYGLNSVSTDETGRSRDAMLAQAQTTSYDNALRVYNSYYNGVGLK
jgi:hypothetical protein